MQSIEELMIAASDFFRGALKGATVDAVGAPVDVISEILRPLGYKEKKPIGGSAHLKSLLGLPEEASSLMETLGGVVTPGGALHAALMGIKLTAGEAKFFKSLQQNVVGKEVRTLDEVPKAYDMPSTVHFDGEKLRVSSKQLGDLKDWIYETVLLKERGDGRLPPSFYPGALRVFGDKATPVKKD